MRAMRAIGNVVGNGDNASGICRGTIEERMMDESKLEVDDAKLAGVTRSFVSTTKASTRTLHPARVATPSLGRSYGPSGTAL